MISTSSPLSDPNSFINQKNTYRLVIFKGEIALAEQTRVGHSRQQVHSPCDFYGRQSRGTFLCIRFALLKLCVFALSAVIDVPSEDQIASMPNSSRSSLDNELSLGRIINRQCRRRSALVNTALTSLPKTKEVSNRQAKREERKTVFSNISIVLFIQRFIRVYLV